MLIYQRPLSPRSQSDGSAPSLLGGQDQKLATCCDAKLTPSGIKMRLGPAASPPGPLCS